MVDNTRGWFFVTTRTTKADGSTTSEIKAGGRPAMVLAVGLVLVLIYGFLMIFSDPPLWLAGGGGAVTAVLFSILAGVQMYLAERQPRG